jgi:hypothetical protein
MTDFSNGASLVADYALSDFTLLLLDGLPDPTFQVTFSGWDNTGADATMAVGIHHPRGVAKQISFENDPTTKAVIFVVRNKHH